MHLAKYEAYIGRLERIADRSHFRFRLRVVALVAFGYALMLLMLTGIFLTAALLVVCRLIVRAARMLALGCHFCVGLCRGMWIKFDPSETIQLDPEQMRPIVEIVDELCAQLGAPKIDRVSVSFDCNAAARQRPKFGPFGPFRNEVTLGLPLLAVFTLEEVRAIIAHEIGHIHRGHVRFAIRVGQISHAWQKALEEIDKNRISAKSLVWVFNWYAPKLRGAQHVLSRISEREANKAEASVAGVAVHVQVCVTLAIYTRVSKDVLTDMYQDSYSQSEMPLDLLVKMCEALGRPRTEESMTELVQQELSLPYNPFSTHPPMSQIVRELGVDPSLDSVLSIAKLPGPDRECAGKAIFGTGFELFVAQVSAAWTEKNRAGWAKDRAKFLKQREELESLLETVDNVPPTNAQAVDVALRLYQAGEFDEAMKWVEPVKDFSSRANLVYGLILKKRENREWIQWVEAAAEDIDLRESASNVLIEHYTALGDRAQVQRIVEQVQRMHDQQAAVRQNFLKLTNYWSYVPCPWSQDEVECLVAHLASFKYVKRAYILGRTNGDSRYDNCCLVVQYRQGIYSPAELTTKVAQQKFPGPCAVFPRDQIPTDFTRAKGALIYERKTYLKQQRLGSDRKVA